MARILQFGGGQKNLKENTTNNRHRNLVTGSLLSGNVQLIQGLDYIEARGGNCPCSLARSEKSYMVYHQSA